MVIIGAGGFAIQLVDTLLETHQNKELIFFDNLNKDKSILFLDRFKIINTELEVRDLFNFDSKFVLGIGNPKKRELMSKSFTSLGGSLTSIISTKSYIGNFNVKIGNGVTILRSVIIDSNVTLGDGVLINHGAIITHDVRIGNFTEISPGVKVLGNVQIGHGCFLGTNSTILPKVIIGNNVKIGAGAVVINDVPDDVTLVGVPAKIIK
jgi:sugar O-acyltransferase (sialic acid O-acetyltransferase NeuD family)